MLITDAFEYDWFGGGTYEALGSGFASTGGGSGSGSGGLGGWIPNINIGVGGVGSGGGGGGAAPSLNQTLTQIVDSYEARLRQNLADWQVGRVTADTAVASAWNLMDGMVISVRAYGVAGEKAAAERDRRINPPMLRWDWIAYYIDPITGGQTALPPPPGGGNNSLIRSGGDQTWLLIGAGLLVLLLLDKD